MNGIINEMVDSGGSATGKEGPVSFINMFNLCINMCNLPLEWRSAIIILLFDGEGGKKECKNYKVATFT
jgi:hypothetical protein